MNKKYNNLKKGATIGEVYNPLIEYAKNNNQEGYDYLKAVGEFIFNNNPDDCKSLEEGIKAAKSNLDYYCQYYDAEIAKKTKEFYELGAGLRLLTGQKL